MQDLILTGASRGIGRALALALASPERRLWLVARDGAALEAVAADVRRGGAHAEVLVGDLSLMRTAAQLGEALAARCAEGAVLVHNAGVWPSARVLTDEGVERAFAVNHLGPLALQGPLLANGKLARLFVVSAGLLVKGRYDAERTPVGGDFSGIRTYCTTKLCLALATQAVAAEHPHVDVAACHPGVVQTDLGARTGPLGWLLRQAKKKWETPEVCAARLALVIGQPRWQSGPGEAVWFFEAERQPWPAPADDVALREQVWRDTQRWLQRGAQAA